MPYTLRGRGGGGGTASLNPAALEGLSPADRVALLRQQRAATRTRGLVESGQAPPVRDQSLRGGEALARMLNSGNPELEQMAQDYYADNPDMVSDEDRELLGLDRPRDKQSNLEKGWGYVGGALEVLDRPSQIRNEFADWAWGGAIEKFNENVLGNRVQTNKRIVDPATGETRDAERGLQDVRDAFFGRPRYIKQTDEWSRDLRLSDLLRQETAQGGWQGAASTGGNLVGAIALDPLNVLGGGSRAGARSVWRTAADELVETGGRGLTRNALEEVGADASREAYIDMFRRRGVQALDDEGRAAVVRRLDAQRAATGKEVPLRTRTANRLTGRTRSERLMLEAQNYGKGGLRVRGLREGNNPLHAFGGRGGVRAFAQEAHGPLPRLLSKSRYIGPEEMDALAVGRGAHVLPGFEDRAAKAAERVGKVSGKKAGDLEGVVETYQKAAQDAVDAVARKRTDKTRTAAQELADSLTEKADAVRQAWVAGDTPALVDALRSGPRVKGDEAALTAAQKIAKAMRKEADAADLAERLQQAVEAGDAAAVAALVPEARKITDDISRVDNGLLTVALRGNPLSRWAENAFVPRARLGRSQRVGADFKDVLHGQKSSELGKARFESDRVVNRLTVRGDGVSAADRVRMADALDIGGDVDALEAEYRAAGKTWEADALRALDEERKAMYKANLDMGIPPERLGSPDDYFPRRWSDEALDFFKRDKEAGTDEIMTRFRGNPGAFRGALKQGGHLNAREFFSTLPGPQAEAELQRIAKEMEQFGWEKFTLDRDPFAAFAKRAQDTQKAVAEVGVLDWLGKTDAGQGIPLARRVKPSDVGTAVEKEVASLAKKQGYRELTGLPDGSRVWVMPDLERDIKDVFQFVNDDAEVKAFGSFFNKWNGLWKVGVTVPVVGGTGFFSRNMQGNIFASYLVGLRDIRYYARAGEVQLAAREAMQKFPDLPVDEALAKMGKADDGRWYRKAVESGSVGEGFFTVDLPVRSDRKLRPPEGKAATAKRVLNPFNTENPIYTSGSTINKYVEDNARLAHFMWAVEKTGSVEDAAASVRKYLFDYTDLTEFERNKIRPYIAFWTYMRNNVPLMVSETVAQPAKVNRWHKIQDFALSGGQEPDYGTGMELSDDGSGVYVPEEVPTASKWDALRGRLIGGGPLSAGSQPVFASADTPFGSAVDSVNPLLQFARLATPLPGGSGEDLARSLLNVPSGGPVEAVKIGVEEATGESLFTGGKIKDQEGERKVPFALRGSQAVLPWLSKSHRNLDRVGVPVPGAEPGAQETLAAAFARSGLGLNVKAVTPEEQERTRSWATEDLLDLLADQSGGGKDQEKIDKWQQMIVDPESTQEEVDGAIAALQLELAKGSGSVPTYAELADVGLVPDLTPAAPSGGGRRLRRGWR